MHLFLQMSKLQETTSYFDENVGRVGVKSDTVYKRRTWAEHVLPVFCACSFHCNSMNNLLSHDGLVDAKIRASDKDLPVHTVIELKEKKTITEIQYPFL